MKKNKYSIRKLSIGVASALIGVSFVNFAGGGNSPFSIVSVSATEENSPNYDNPSDVWTYIGNRERISSMVSPFKAKVVNYSFGETKDVAYANEWRAMNLFQINDDEFFKTELIYNTSLKEVSDVVLVVKLTNENNEFMYELTGSAEPHELFEAEYSVDNFNKGEENSVNWSKNLPENLSSVTAIRFKLKDPNSSLGLNFYKQRIPVRVVKKFNDHLYVSNSISSDNGNSFDYYNNELFDNHSNEASFYTSFELEDGTEIRERVRTDVCEPDGNCWRFSAGGYYMSGNSGTFTDNTLTTAHVPISINYKNKEYVFDRYRENSYPVLGIVPFTPDGSKLEAYSRLIYIPKYSDKINIKFENLNQEKIHDDLLLEGESNSELPREKVVEIINNLKEEDYSLTNEDDLNISFDHDDSTTQEVTLKFSKKEAKKYTVKVISVDEDGRKLGEVLINDIDSPNYDFSSQFDNNHEIITLWDRNFKTTASNSDPLFEKVKENYKSDLEYDYMSYVLSSVDKPLTGNLEEGENVFVLTYKRMLEDVAVDGTLTINYLDKNNQPLKSPTTITKYNIGIDKNWRGMATNGMNQDIDRKTLIESGVLNENIPWTIEYNNTDYNVTENSNDFSIDNKNYKFNKELSSPLTGVFNSTNIVLNLFFDEELTISPTEEPTNETEAITVNFVTPEGERLKDSTTITLNNNNYDLTTIVDKDEIVEFNGKRYVVSPEVNLTGTTDESSVSVVFVPITEEVEEERKNIELIFVDTNGNKLIENEIIPLDPNTVRYDLTNILTDPTRSILKVNDKVYRFSKLTNGESFVGETSNGNTLISVTYEEILPIEKEIIKEVPVEVEKIVEVPVEVEKIVEVPVEVEKVVEKEIIKEVPVETIKEIEKEVIKEIPVEVEKIVEKIVIKEVPVETNKEVEKETPVEPEKQPESTNNKQDNLPSTSTIKETIKQDSKEKTTESSDEFVPGTITIQYIDEKGNVISSETVTFEKTSEKTKTIETKKILKLNNKEFTSNEDENIEVNLTDQPQTITVTMKELVKPKIEKEEPVKPTVENKETDNKKELPKTGVEDSSIPLIVTSLLTTISSALVRRRKN